MTDLRDAARQALELLKELQGGCTDSDDGTVEALTVWCPEVIENLEAALEQPEQATGKESLQVGQEEPEGGWQSAPSPQVTQRIADMPMSEYRRGVNDGFKLGLREGRIKAEDEMREQPEQEPVAHVKVRPLQGNEWQPKVEITWVSGPFAGPLYTHPPRREPLSNEELDRLWREPMSADWEHREYARAIEAAHNIKENT
jgi:hypothetical protein